MGIFSKRHYRPKSVIDNFDIKILEAIINQDNMTMVQLTNKIKLSHKNRKSHTLKLESLGLIKTNKVATTIYINITPNGKTIYELLKDFN
jgi:predicted transcriptional regulator